MKKILKLITGFVFSILGFAAIVFGTLPLIIVGSIVFVVTIVFTSVGVILISIDIMNSPAKTNLGKVKSALNKKNRADNKIKNALLLDKRNADANALFDQFNMKSNGVKNSVQLRPRASYLIAKSDLKNSKSSVKVAKKNK